MRITDNLKKDISNAPKWFFDAIEIEPKEEFNCGNLDFVIQSLTEQDANLAYLTSRISEAVLKSEGENLRP